METDSFRKHQTPMGIDTTLNDDIGLRHFSVQCSDLFSFFVR